MVQWELDSFNLKFKNVLHSEKDATLTLKSEAGRALVKLSRSWPCSIGTRSTSKGGHRKGPARQRWHEKCDAAHGQRQSAENVDAKDRS